MAGVGFELNRILARENYTATIQAYAYAGLVSSGPWLIAVVSLGLIGLALGASRPADELRLFFVSLSFIYAVTLVLTGPLQMVLTRYAADQMFAQRSENIFPTFISSLAWTSAGSALIGMAVFLGAVPGPLLFRLAAAATMVIVAGIWIAGIFLTAIKQYLGVVAGFGLGCSISFFGAWGLATRYGVGGAMLGFALGQAVVLLFLCAAIFTQLGTLEIGRPDFLGAFRKYWELALGGFLYNLGIWIDKFLYWWFDPAAESVAGLLHAAPVYDRVVYFSFLTIIPGMAVFLLKLETEFSLKNEQFFQHVLRKATLDQILKLKEEMITAFREGFTLLLKIQGLCTGLLILSADKLLRLLHLSAVQTGVFQISLLGVFLLVLFLALQTILYYLDKRRDAMLCALVFMLVNGLLTAASILGGERWHGFGFLVAAAVATVIASYRVNRHLQNLDYDTFTSQPIYG